MPSLPFLVTSPSSSTLRMLMFVHGSVFCGTSVKTARSWISRSVASLLELETSFGRLGILASGCRLWFGL